MIVVMMPFPSMIASGIAIAVHAFPSPVIIVSVPASWLPLIIMVVILLRKYSAMMFRERIAGIRTRSAIVANASATVLSVAGSGRASGQRREQNGENNFLHFNPPLFG